MDREPKNKQETDVIEERHALTMEEGRDSLQPSKLEKINVPCGPDDGDWLD